MLIEFGHFALVLAFVVALVQMTLPMLGAAGNGRRHSPSCSAS
jgi:cytochrome c biogenesis factor